MISFDFKIKNPFSHIYYTPLWDKRIPIKNWFAHIQLFRYNTLLGTHVRIDTEMLPKGFYSEFILFGYGVSFNFYGEITDEDYDYD